MENPLVALSNELATAVAIAGETVVSVHGRPRVHSSGVLWMPGVVVTADHTLRRDEDIRVTLPNGTTVPAEIAGRDSGTDLAVLKLEDQCTPAAKPTEPNPLKAGNLVLAVGRSHETGVNAALGVLSTVSGPWHTWRGGMIDQFLRLDVGLYPGASGGAVVDATGALIGIATGGLSRTSALAIPRVTIARVVEAILKSGHVARGYLGIGLQPVGIPEHLRTQLGISGKTGLIVLSVEEQAPAGRAGMVIGDVLLALNGNAVSDTDDVQAVLGPEFVGKDVAASVLRGGTRAEFPITIGERPQRRG
jgi:S1-C subfamily serine protease